ncbi:transmembrane protein 256-like isoform X1 [Salvelinus fontinalis]|uniref:transmembrane protein 256-like isoform X1 n=1 Tax=Salvelinus fontinalis TaxID=8038 RepID=UPI002485BD67|nr:transmembrane protein 256-like isoform X1 [Salvelinus fontinalis]
MTASLVVQRLAGVSGALAVTAGAYGAHGFKNKDPDDYSIVTVLVSNVSTSPQLYETANKYHFYHSIALLGASRCRKPAVAGALLVAGMGAFCGSLYHQALTEDPVLRKLAPYGGMLLIAGWLAIAI